LKWTLALLSNIDFSNSPLSGGDGLHLPEPDIRQRYRLTQIPACGRQLVNKQRERAFFAVVERFAAL
jgi:hypothetical protein